MFSSFHSLNTFVFSSLESKLVRSRVSSSPLTHQMRESRETGSRNPAGQPTHRKLTLAEPGVLGGTGSTEPIHRLHRGRRAVPHRPIRGNGICNALVTFPGFVSQSIRRGFCGVNREGDHDLSAGSAEIGRASWRERVAIA